MGSNFEVNNSNLNSVSLIKKKKKKIQPEWNINRQQPFVQ